MTAGIDITLLGGFEVSSGERLLSEDCWRLRKAKSLVKLLALSPGHQLRKEQASELLWPGRDPGSASNNFHQALHAARNALGELDDDARRSLSFDEGLLSLRGAVIDVDRFETAAEAALQESEPSACEEALGLYGGELLPEDAYEDWSAERRERLKARRLEVLVTLARCERDRGNAGAAIRALEIARSEDEHHEPAVRELMATLAAEGRLQEALAAYQRLRASLRTSLEADPDPQTRRLNRELLSDSLESPIAAPGTRPARPLHNLPHPISSFIGRGRELAAIAGRLERARALTLIGVGGVGKTRLALEAARDQLELFAHGVWLVDLATISDPRLVAVEIAEVLELDLPDQTPELQALTGHIGERQLLLVLDNCEHLIEASADAAAEILRACPRVSILATSRQALRIEGEVTWRVPSLDLPETAYERSPDEVSRLSSVALFCDRAAAAAPSFELQEGNAGAVCELCRRLDGLPLAIELAAARIPLLSPAELVERLAKTLDSLGEGSRDRLTRQRTLAATIGWSHELLSEPERVLFRRLAVFAGSFPLAAAEGICMSPEDPTRTLELLEGLVEKSLVLSTPEDGTVRFRILETVRAYAREQLQASGELEASERAHLDWYTGFAERHDPELSVDRMTLDFRAVEAEHDNLRIALDVALRNDPERALRLATSLWRFWLARGLFNEGRRWLETALATAGEPSHMRSRALFGTVVLDCRRGVEPYAVAEALDEILEIRRRSGDRLELASALSLTGLLTVYSPRGVELARERIMEGAAIARELDATHILASAEHGLGYLELVRGETVGARTHLEASRELLASLSEEIPGVVPAIAPGWVLEWGEGEKPRAVFLETIVLGQRLSSRVAAGLVTHNLAWVALEEGEPGWALELGIEAAESCRRNGWHFGEAVVLSQLGNIHRRRGAYEEAETCLKRSLDLRGGLGDRRGSGMVYGNLGLLRSARGEVDEAKRVLRRALELFERTDDRRGIWGMLLNLGVVSLRAGEIDAARGLLAQALAGRRTFGFGSIAGWIAVMLAEITPGEGRESLLREARSAFRSVGDRRGIAYLQGAYVRAKPAQSAPP
jgi:predicted ATPase/DNA-binding SARP family transcriptional activator